MILEICACVFFQLIVSGGAWPRYGRPHPLYNGRLQTNENIFANAVLLGFDFNEIQSLQAAGGQGFGLGNLGLPNNGFPMNAYERKRARQDINTLTALGVIDSPEEAGPLGALGRKSAPDPPDHPGAKDGGKKAKKKPGAKVQGKGKGKVKTKGQKKQGTVAKNVGQSGNNMTSNSPDKTILQVEKSTKRPNKRAKQGIGIKGRGLIISNTKSTMKRKAAGAVRKGGKKKVANKRRKLWPQNRGGEADGEGGINRSKQRRNRNGGIQQAGGDPGEGRLAEQGVGDFPQRPIRGRGGRRVLWRTGGEEARGGRGEV
ncbi:uncharacterized protein LOC123547181 [Mercenaria mercenaria]|uniref:uncharacterized protein LOC123547181 n=1 Tax=Mercenaria mercenaria TaxID=6596 RepID=UPI001E1D3382|nr:uncharacterized protein LOC123547181 [Mercenaria mercenaria]